MTDSGSGVKFHSSKIRKGQKFGKYLENGDREGGNGWKWK